MNAIKKNILVVEEDPLLCCRFQSAFMISGYHVQTTDKFDEVAAIINNGKQSQRPFDLVLVDMSDVRYTDLLAELQRSNINTPVFTVKGARDKGLIIDMLNEKRNDFIEQFVESNNKTSRATAV